MPNCCCKEACLVFSANFNLPDETWPNGSFDTGPFDSTGKWIGRDSADAHNKWRIASNELVITTTGESASTARPAARHIENINVVDASVEVKMKIPTGGLIQSFSINIITDLITGSAQLYTAFVKIIPGDCGTLQLFGKNNSGSTVQLGADIPLPGLVVNSWFTVKLCLNAQFKLASCSVGGNWHHGTTEPQDDPGDTRREVISTITVDEQANGTYHFDDFKLIELKQEVGYGYYYGYGYGDERKCPCCRPGGCETISVDFTDPDNDGKTADEIDCRISVDSGTAEQSDGSLALSDGAELTWLGSWSGIGKDCLIDETTYVAVSFKSATYGASVTIAIGDVSATITLESAADAGDGSLALSTGDSTTISATINESLTLSVCRYPDGLVASGGGGQLEAAVETSADTPIAVANSEIVDVTEFIVSHNLFDLDCAQCVSTTFTPCELCPDGQAPAHVVVTIEGLSCPSNPALELLNGSHLLNPGSSPVGSCCWQSEGGPFVPPQITACVTSDHRLTVSLQVDCISPFGGSIAFYETDADAISGCAISGHPAFVSTDCLDCNFSAATIRVFGVP